jgi:DNA-binding NtrC family response regulator
MPPLVDDIMLGDSAPMRRLRALIATVAPTRIPVLIEGPTGTGKELVARTLHAESQRSGALVALNVCAVGDSMFEDALFGHARGAYTGAITESAGFLREAHDGTMFLDEITGLPLPLQAKLLRAIETGVFRPIGASRDVRSDFRTVVATNESVDGLVSRGLFRADLAHRLSGVVLAIPALRERSEDIPLLVRHFVARAAHDRIVSVSDSAIEMLMLRDWPGNVRELRQVVETAVAFAASALDAAAISAALAHRSRAGPTSGGVQAGNHNLFMARRELLAALERASWATDAVAETLGVHRATVYRRMKRLGIEGAGVDPKKAKREAGASARTRAV